MHHVCVCVILYILECVFEDIGKMNAIDRESYKKECTLAKVVMDGMEAVRSKKKQDLANYKARFLESSNHTESSGSAGQGGKAATVGSAPPTGTTQDLMQLHEIETFPATVHQVITDKKEYPDMKKKLAAMLDPIKELITAAKGRKEMITKRKDALKSAAKSPNKQMNKAYV